MALVLSVVSLVLWLGFVFIWSFLEMINPKIITQCLKKKKPAFFLLGTSVTASLSFAEGSNSLLILHDSHETFQICFAK